VSVNACALFDITPATPKPVGLFDYKLKPQPFAQVAHERLIAIGFVTAQTMIQVSGHHRSDVALVSQRNQPIQQRNRIWSARESDEDARIDFDPVTHECLGDSFLEFVFGRALHCLMLQMSGERLLIYSLYL
jgi:hypothetical protein